MKSASYFLLFNKGSQNPLCHHTRLLWWSTQGTHKYSVLVQYCSHRDKIAKWKNDPECQTGNWSCSSQCGEAIWKIITSQEWMNLSGQKTRHYFSERYLEPDQSQKGNCKKAFTEFFIRRIKSSRDNIKWEISPSEFKELWN